MKKEDMLIEQGKLVQQIGYMTLNILQPFSQLIGACQRVAYLQAKIEEVTPKQEVTSAQVVNN